MMKLSNTVVVLLSVLGIALAESPNPQLFIGISNIKGLGKFDDGSLGGLEPALKWETAGSAPGFDWEAGLNMRLEDTNTMPYSAWGKVKKTVSGFLLSARGDVNSKNLETIAIDLRVDGPSTSIDIVGSAGSTTLSIGKLSLRKTIEIAPGKVTVSPRYNVGSKKADVGISYAVSSTSVTIDSGSQKLTIAQVVGGNTLVMPSICPDGQFDVTVQRNFDGIGRITAAVKPNSSINLTWENGPWVANMNAPMDGFKFSGADVSVKRKVDL